MRGKTMEKKGKVSGPVQGIIAAVAVVVVCMLVNIAFSGKFLTGNNISAILTMSIISCFAAWAFCFIFACGYIDLSLGAILVLVGNAAGELGNVFGIPGVIIGGLVAGIVLCGINFSVYLYTKIPAWIAGLALCLIYEAIGAFYGKQAVANGGQVVLLREELRGLARAPWIYIIFAVALIAMYFFFNRSSLGLSMRALGGNRKVSEAMGIRTNRVILLVALVTGIMIGIGGFLTESNNGQMLIRSGLKSLTQCLKPLSIYLMAAVLQKKINIIIAIPICAVLEFALFNVLTLAGVPSGTLQDACSGALIVIFGIFAQRGSKEIVK